MVKRNNPYCSNTLKNQNELCFCVDCSEYRAESDMYEVFERMKNIIENGDSI